MKKILLFSFVVLLLAGCTDKNNYEAAVLADLENDAKNAPPKDYKIPLDKMASCIVEATSAHMPGLFGFDPDRLSAYRNYTKMLTLGKSQDPKKTMEELRNEFGSPQALIEARGLYIESQLECLSTFVAGGDEK